MIAEVKAEYCKPILVKPKKKRMNKTANGVLRTDSTQNAAAARNGGTGLTRAAATAVPTTNATVKAAKVSTTVVRMPSP